MSFVPPSIRLNYTLTTRDRDWIIHQLPKECIAIPREHLPDPDSENLPSGISRQETPAELEKRWTDVGVDRIPLKFASLRF